MTKWFNSRAEIAVTILLGVTVALLAAQTRLDMPTQVRDKNGQTIIDLSQARNYVSLQRFVCAGSGGTPPNAWNCAGIEYYKFTLKDGTTRDFAVGTAWPELRTDVATGPPKWTVQVMK